VCRVEDIAVRVLCPVVSKQIMRNEVVMYGGAVHLSKEFMIGDNGKKCYGAVYLPVDEDRSPVGSMMGSPVSPGSSAACAGSPGYRFGNTVSEGSGDGGGSADGAGESGYRFGNRISADTWVAGLSQEHGIIRGSFDEIRAMFPGDLLEIIPVHSCLAADIAGHYLTTDGTVLKKIRRSED